MKIVLENPLAAFINAAGKSSIEKLIIVSPFISDNGLKPIIGWLLRKKTKIKVLTNLSMQNVALSINNPVAALKDISKKLAGRVEIRWNPSLHAKMYYLPEKLLLFGSSNLTGGGMENNHEINCLLDARKKEEREHISGLDVWFSTLWENANCLDNIEKMLRIEHDWEKANGKLMGLIGNLMPLASLGGNYWHKLLEICKRKKWKRMVMDKLLNEGEGEQKNTIRKLVFLKNLGIIDFDDTFVSVLKKVSSQEQAYHLVANELNCLPMCLIEISNSDGSTYQELATSLEVREDDMGMHAAVNWLENLGLISREKGKDRRDMFNCTKAGKKLLPKPK